MASTAQTTELADGKLLLDRPAEHVVRLTIANPAKRNALDHPILDAISVTLGRLADERERPLRASDRLGRHVLGRL